MNQEREMFCGAEGFQHQISGFGFGSTLSLKIVCSWEIYLTTLKSDFYDNSEDSSQLLGSPREAGLLSLLSLTPPYLTGMHPKGSPQTRPVHKSQCPRNLSCHNWSHTTHCSEHLHILFQGILPGTPGCRYFYYLQFTDEKSNLPKVTELASCTARIPMQALKCYTHCLLEHFCGLASKKLKESAKGDLF